ncbi:CMP/dCMP deaminase [Verticillium alfalfae VaMs.102]|uniref:CMP/dCMP deaminase n=1 Tax=Verticillium alfalfae (strain VaMs.102 / ATCC MYA-4576 / FGSC 10136) TaxID=526221 RepID=C9SGB2_VERA1|nr:CMP/dCMP deaminase [Verticillium alfalfae VaMs.102]EEY17452.1 CMP/dCMP deaminase [Verticillium alfalfae VaMs.102]
MTLVKGDDRELSNDNTSPRLSCTQGSRGQSPSHAFHINHSMSAYNAFMKLQRIQQETRRPVLAPRPSSSPRSPSSPATTHSALSSSPSSGKILHQDRNRTVTGRHGDGKPDSTYHPEIELARWAQQNLGADERAASVVYTSGEHCAMCSLAHAYCGLGKIVFVSSTNQYRAWLAEFGAPTPQVANLGIADVAPHIPIEGPIDGLVDEVKELQRRNWLARGGQ